MERSASNHQTLRLSAGRLTQPPPPASATSPPMMMEIDPVTPVAEHPPTPSVGFAASHTVVEASSSQESASAIRKQLAPVFSSTSKHKTSIFLKVHKQGTRIPRIPPVRPDLSLKTLGNCSSIKTLQRFCTVTNKPVKTKRMHAQSYPYFLRLSLAFSSL